MEKFGNLLNHLAIMKQIGLWLNVGTALETLYMGTLLHALLTMGLYSHGDDIKIRSSIRDFFTACVVPLENRSVFGQCDGGGELARIQQATDQQNQADPSNAT